MGAFWPPEVGGRGLVQSDSVAANPLQEAVSVLSPTLGAPEAGLLPSSPRTYGEKCPVFVGTVLDVPKFLERVYGLPFHLRETTPPSAVRHWALPARSPG